jgi:hypothetical protein
MNQEERKFLDNLQQKMTLCLKDSTESQKDLQNFSFSQNCLKKRYFIIKINFSKILLGMPT